MLALLSSLCEINLVMSTRTFLHSVGYWRADLASLIFGIFMAFSTGMYISSTAYLPSSFSMVILMLVYANWQNTISNFSKSLITSLRYLALCGIFGWPFSVVLGLPIIVDMFIMLRKRTIRILFKVGIESLSSLVFISNKAITFS